MNNKSNEYNKNTFFCDHCFTEQIEILVNGNMKLYNEYFRCATKQKWIKHCNTRKHKYNKAMLQTLEDELITECNVCETVMSNEAYNHHKNRNMIYWAVRKNPDYKDSCCNNFIISNKNKKDIRFPTIETLGSYKDMEREPNGRKKRIYEKMEKEQKSVTSNIKMDIEEIHKSDIKEMYSPSKVVWDEDGQFTRCPYKFKMMCKCGLPKNEPYVTLSEREKYGLEVCSSFCDEDSNSDSSEYVTDSD